MVVKPFLEICTVPCFLRTSLDRNSPWFNLEFLFNLYTLLELNLGPYVYVMVLKYLGGLIKIILLSEIII